jgi:hypothetical protein
MRRAGSLGLLVAALLHGGVVYAFASSNTLPSGGSGEGSGAVSGVVVEDIDYRLRDSDPSRIDAVQFRLNEGPAAGSTVAVNVDGTWHDCSHSGSDVSCGLGGIPVAQAGELRVVVAD